MHKVASPNLLGARQGGHSDSGRDIIRNKAISACSLQAHSPWTTQADAKALADGCRAAWINPQQQQVQGARLTLKTL